MKRLGLLCLAVVASLGLCGCENKLQVPNETTKVTDVQNKKTEYVGKYVMRRPLDGEDEELPEDSLSHEDLGIKSEVLCIEIKDNNDVNVCIGGFAAHKAKLVKEDGEKYIKLESPYLDGFTDKILLGEKEVDGKNYLTFENEDGERAYFEKAKNQDIVSRIEIKDDETFDVIGILEIDYEITKIQTGQSPYNTWGSGFRTHGSSMKINQDGTGNYSIGVAEYENFKLVKDNGKTYIEIINKEYSMGPDEGTRFLLEAKQIEGENYLLLHGDNGIDSCWKCVDDGQIVFEDQDGTIRIWG